MSAASRSTWSPRKYNQGEGPQRRHLLGCALLLKKLYWAFHCFLNLAFLPRGHCPHQFPPSPSHIATLQEHFIPICSAISLNQSFTHLFIHSFNKVSLNAYCGTGNPVKDSCPHTTEVEIEAQIGYTIHPRSHGQLVTKPGSKFTSPRLQIP